MTAEPRPLRVAMASHGDLAFDSRVQREALALAAAGHQVTLLCVEPGGELPTSLTTGVKVVAQYPNGLPADANRRHARARGGAVGRIVDRAVWLFRYRSAATRWGRWAVAQAGPVDIWHLHDFPALAAIAPRLPRSMPMVYDSHEVFLDSGTAARLPGPIRRVLRRQERQLASRVLALVTVNDGVAHALARLGIRRVVVVHNYPPRPGDLEDDGRLRRAAGVPAGHPIILSHGAITTDRGLEQLVDAVATPSLPDAHLVLLGFGSLGPILAAQAEANGVADRVHILPAVPPDELLQWVIGADVGALPTQPTSANELVSTPNKLFESLAAGVPVVVSNFPEVKRLVVDAPEGPLGVTCNPTDVASIAAAIRSILDRSDQERAALRARCRAAVAARMNWPVEATRLTDLYADLDRSMGKGGTGGVPQPA